MTGPKITVLTPTYNRADSLGDDYRPRLLALEVRSGKEVWSSGEDVFGTFLNYSSEHDILLQAGSAYRDRADDEVDTGMVAYRGADGEHRDRAPTLVAQVEQHVRRRLTRDRDGRLRLRLHRRI